MTEKGPIYLKCANPECGNKIVWKHHGLLPPNQQETRVYCCQECGVTDMRRRDDMTKKKGKEPEKREIECKHLFVKAKPDEDGKPMVDKTGYCPDCHRYVRIDEKTGRVKTVEQLEAAKK